MAHKALVNCISFCSWDLNKLFTTSYDGSFGCSDIAKNTFDIVSIIVFLKVYDFCF